MTFFSKPSARQSTPFLFHNLATFGCPIRLALVKHNEFASGHFNPARFARQWLGSNHGNAVVARCHFAKVNRQVLIDELGNVERWLANEIM